MRPAQGQHATSILGTDKAAVQEIPPVIAGFLFKLEEKAES